MVYGKDQLALYMAPGRHGRIHMEKYFARGEKCPIAISFGHDPLLFILGGMQVPTDVSEYEYAGGIRKEPLKVMPGPMTGLPLPYDSEIVIEGEISPDDNGPEGPFGEYTGYYGGAERTEPIIRVSALYHRDSPIICGAAPGRPPMDTTYWEQFQVAARIWTQIEAAGVPDVKGVWCHFPGANFFIVVSITQRYAGHAKQAALLASQCHAGAHMNRYVVVVDDDIDVTNINDVLWAMCTRTDPVRDIDITTDSWSQRLDTAIEPGTNLNSKAIINACRPYHRLTTFPAVAEASPEERKRVLEKWRSVLDAPNGVATTAPETESRQSR
jgi:4-hydroxy-3-polyprenylbenzoate decarboxylase